MKLVSFITEEQERLGVCVSGMVYGMEVFENDLPRTMDDFLDLWEDSFPVLKSALASIDTAAISKGYGIPIQEIQLLAPVPFPMSCRDGYAFRQHVAAARRNRKLDMIPEFDEYPIFYFTNHL